MLQGSFTGAKILEWCERGLLQRIHRRTIGALRERVRPVAPSEFVRFLLRWQHVMPGTRLHGVEGVAKVIDQLEGLELPAAAWEREILPARVHDYAPAMLDELCLSGEVAWARLRVTPPEGRAQPARARRRHRPVRARARGLADRSLRAHRRAGRRSGRTCRRWRAQVAARARAARRRVRRRSGGSARAARCPRSRTRCGSWRAPAPSPATASPGCARCLTPRAERPRRGVAGRWSLLHRDAPRRAEDAGPFGDGSPVELAWAYLRRWGVMMRQLLVRESAAPPWRELVAVYRRLEARGEIRGGRFVSGMSGEQFALAEAVEALRALWPQGRRRWRPRRCASPPPIRSTSSAS